MTASMIFRPLRLNNLINTTATTAPRFSTVLQAIPISTGVAANDILCIFENNYIDENYSDEFAAYYSKILQMPSKLCTRLHLYDLTLFAVPPIPQLHQLASEPSSYLGYLSLRPWCRVSQTNGSLKVDIKRGMDSRLIAFAQWNPTDKQATGLVVPSINTKMVHLRGYSFQAKGVPFTQQESRVGACAQAAIWVADKVMHIRYHSKRHSTSQITLQAKSTLSYGRLIPSHDHNENGLVTSQMLSAATQMGLEPLYYSWDLNAMHRATPDRKAALAGALWKSLFAYVSSGIPVVLFGDVGSGWHAVTAIGYVHGYDNTKCKYSKAYKGIVFHDDQEAPYIASPSWNQQDNILQYPNGQRSIRLKGMIIPMPGKVFLTATDAYKAIESVENMRDDASYAGTSLSRQHEQQIIPTAVNKHIILRLISAGDYLEAIEHLNTKQPARYPSLCRKYFGDIELPRFLWVAEYHCVIDHNETVYGTVIMDSTADFEDAVLYIQFFDHVGYRQNGVDIIQAANGVTTYDSTFRIR
jgi:hypothetical protein